MQKITLLFIINCCIVFSQTPTQEKLANIFPASSIPTIDNANFNFTTNFSNSGSTWAISFPETDVYRALMSYSNPTNPNQSYQLRIGKGGQIYSFITASGETVPPQYRSSTDVHGADHAPWVDEVWQMVAVDTDQNDPGNDMRYFIHQAGVYFKDPVNLSQPFYSPQIASYYNATNQEYTTVNWGQHAHIDQNLVAGFTSSLLYYTKFKNIGNGIIQVDYIMYNFGQDEISFVNVPWGGVRQTTYDNFFVSSVDNNFTHSEGRFNSNSFTTATTNGWVAFSSNDTGTLPSLGLIMNNNEGVLRIGDAGTADGRNYTVYEGVKSGLDLDFGKALRARNYFILDSSVADIQATIASLDLQENTFFGYDTKTVDEVDNSYSFFEKNSTIISRIETTSTDGLNLKLQPYANSYPLFIIKGINSSNQEEYQITSNLYTYSNLPYDGKTMDIQLLGFSDSKKEITLENAVVTYGGSYTFPDGTTQNNINSVTTHFSDLGPNANGYNQLIQTTLTVTSDPILKNGNAWYHNYETNTFNAPTISTTGTFLEQTNAVATPTNIGNSSVKVAKFTKDAGIHSNIRFALPGSITPTNKASAIFKIKLYVPSNATVTDNNIKIILREENSGTTQISSTQTITNFDVWQEYTFDFSNVTFTGTNYDYLNLFFAQPDTDGDATGNVYYFDALQGPFNSNLSTNSFELKSFQVFPNPITDSFQINTEESIKSVSLFNMTGQLVKTFTASENYDISDLKAGVYFATVTSEIVPQTLKIVKK